MSSGRAEQRGASCDSNFNLSLTWPSSIAKSDLLHDGCSGSPRLAETTSGRNLGVFVSSEQPSPQNRWGGGFSSPPSLNLYPSLLPSQHPQISIFFFCHPFTLPWTRGVSTPGKNPRSLSYWQLAAHTLHHIPLNDLTQRNWRKKEGRKEKYDKIGEGNDEKELE